MQWCRDVKPTANGHLALDEPERLAALHNYAILDTPPEPAFDRISALAAWFFHVPMAAIALVDGDRIWLKSSHGLAPDLVDHRVGLWDAAVLADDVYSVPNAAEDKQARASPLVTGELGLRFYAAAPLRTREGYNLGALCVIDRQPRLISDAEKEFLRRMAGVVMELMELRQAALTSGEPTEHLTEHVADKLGAGWDETWTNGASNPSPNEWGAEEWGEPPVPAHHLHIGFNRSLLGKPEQRQLEWLSGRIVGDSPAMRTTHNLMRLAIIRHADMILLMGETGTGKGLCAQAIHDGAGSRGRFVEINCGALPRDLIESELFGHEKGAFTGAAARHAGLFEQAQGGTVFLDEITELPPDLQVKLLSVLQGRELRRLGGTTAIPINVRVIAATNRKLAEAISDGSFRRDLFFRLGSCRIQLPPLRHRGDDAILLVRHFLASIEKAKGRPLRGIAPEAAALLQEYDWPGNVRQLMNMIEQAAMLETGIQLSAETVRYAIEEEKKLFDLADGETPDEAFSNETEPNFTDARRITFTEDDAHALRAALARNHYNKSRTARELGLTRGQLEYRLKLLEQMDQE